ncbi:hypothetical protein DFA_02857 [Cavenderia fasciculata]|uniref:Uncharacterized protein n=1 Tax=Cavenderia fasciculata TaxID=261658 RepID=F4PIN4_CACFS|nr:uncharacterized protein DFA_02857 [Cavenderia fasciculata]EGG24614.1 hypothetical protein DFA_02857 [Cavenderia fasciculata]|eukprot:XP_004362465.1 hypothetical protein DFA_02857 [Cavenderia fasciculata]
MDTDISSSLYSCANKKLNCKECGSILVKHPKRHIEGHPAPDQSYHCKRCDFQFTPCDEDGCDEIMWILGTVMIGSVMGNTTTLHGEQSFMKEYHDAPDFYQPDCPMEDEDCEYCIEWLEKNKLE